MARVYVAAIDGSDARAVTAPGTSMTRVRWSRDGQALLGILDDGRVARTPAAGGAPTALAIEADAVDDCGDALALRIATLAGDRLVLWRDGRVDELYRSQGSLSDPRCDSSGQRIVVTESHAPVFLAGGDVLVVDRAHHVARLTTDHAAGPAAFTPDGRAIVLTARREHKLRLFVMSAAGGVRHELTREGGPDFEPDVARDGRSVAFHTQPRSTLVVVGGPGREPVTIGLERQTIAGLAPLRTRDAVVAERREAEDTAIVVIDLVERSERQLVKRGEHPFVSLDDRTVYFSPPGDGRALASIAIDGDHPAPLATFPARVIAGVAGPDGVHVLLDHDGALEGWRLADGAPVAEGVAGLVSPAPAGGWRAIAIPDGRHARLRLVAPGAPLAAGRELVADALVPTWIDDHRLGYIAGHAYRIVDVTTGDEQTWPSPDATASSVIAPDGVRWLDARPLGHTTRRLLVNFAQRPWKDTR